MSFREAVYGGICWIQFIYVSRVSFFNNSWNYPSAVFDTLMFVFIVIILWKHGFKRTYYDKQTNWMGKMGVVTVTIIISVYAISMLMIEYPIYLWGLLLFPHTVVINVAIVDLIFMREITEKVNEVRGE